MICWTGPTTFCLTPTHILFNLQKLWKRWCQLVSQCIATKGWRMFAGDHKRVFVPRCIVPSQGQGSALVWMNMIFGGPGLTVETQTLKRSALGTVYLTPQYCDYNKLATWDGLLTSLWFTASHRLDGCLKPFNKGFWGSQKHWWHSVVLLTLFINNNWHWHGCPHRTSSKMSRKKRRAILWKIINQ